jgi:N-acetylneuraminic acid mutarotase
MKKSLLFIFLFVTAFTLSGIAQTWTQRANYNGTAVYGAFAFSIGNKGYVGSGSNTSAYYNEFWEYDATLDTWSQKTNVPGNMRYQGIAFAIGNYGYAGTGYSVSVPASSDMYKYDPSLNTWTAIAPMPVGRVTAVAFTIGNKGYVLTGDHTSNSQGNPSSDVWEYDPAGDTWTAKAAVPGVARENAFGFAIAGKGYIGGGYTGSTNLADFYEFDPQANTWTTRTNIPVATRGASGFAIGYRGFFVNGYNTTNANQLYEYDPISNSWTARPNFGGSARYGSAAFVIGIDGYVGGGRANSSVYADWWEYSDETLGVTEVNKNPAVEIYPNPVANSCTINIANANGVNEFQFELYDVTGKCVRTSTISQQSVFSREGLSSGVYFYKVSGGKDVFASGEMLVK